VFVAQSHLDVSVPCNELDELLKEVEQVGSVTEKALDAGILGHSIDLAAVVLEDNADELADGNNEGAKGNGAHVVAEAPPQAAADRALTSRVGVNLEVPDAGRGCNDELAHTHDESIEPEEHEKLVQHNVASVVAPFDLSEEL